MGQDGSICLEKASSGTFGSRVMLSTDGIWPPSSCMVILCTPTSHSNKWSDHWWSHAVTGKLRHKRKKNQAEANWEIWTHLREVQHWREPRNRMPTRWSEDTEPVPSPLHGSSRQCSIRLSLSQWNFFGCPHVPCTLLGKWQCPGPLFIYGICHAT